MKTIIILVSTILLLDHEYVLPLKRRFSMSETEQSKD